MKKVTKNIKKKLKRYQTLKYLTKYAGKGVKGKYM